MNSILIVAHAPMAQSLRSCALHVDPDLEHAIAALDIQANLSPEESLAAARVALAGCDTAGTLVLTDLFGATPCNVAQRLIENNPNARLLAGVNLPMLLRAVNYRGEPLEAMAERALAGGIDGIRPVSVSAPQHQPKRTHDDQNHHDHQQ